MLADQIKADLPTALKAGESLRVSVIRMLLSELNYKHIDLQRELTDEDVIGVIQKEVKKRREAIESFRSGGREEQAKSEEAEMGLLQAYLPQMLSEEEILTELKASSEFEGETEFSKVMRVAAPKFRGRAEGSVVAKVVKDWLATKQ